MFASGKYSFEKIYIMAFNDQFYYEGACLSCLLKITASILVVSVETEEVFSSSV